MKRKIRFQRKNLTFSLDVNNLDVGRADQYVLQLSLVDPWLVPTKKLFKNKRSWVAGWLFLYVGHFVHVKGEPAVAEGFIEYPMEEKQSSWTVKNTIFSVAVGLSLSLILYLIAAGKANYIDMIICGGFSIPLYMLVRQLIRACGKMRHRDKD